MSNYKLIHLFNKTPFTNTYVYQNKNTNRMYISITPPSDNIDFLDLKKEINYGKYKIEYLGNTYNLPLIEKFTNKIYKIRIVEPRTCFASINQNTYSSMMNYKQLLDYFFPDMDCIIVDENEPADIAIIGNSIDDNNKLRKNEVNIFISIENVPHFGYYAHYKKYGEYGDNMINIYVYNHINMIDIKPNYIAIPTVYFRMNYFINNYDYYYKHPELNIDFKNKKFCLMINKSGLNNNITKLVDELNKIEQVDNISQYNDMIKNKSCYNSLELLKVFNKYKFIICFENSYNDGYITEKIFNCLFAKTIPIYSGSDKITEYINNYTIIHIKKDDTIDLELVRNINNSEKLYNKYITLQKVNNNYYQLNDYFKKLYIDTINRVINNNL